MGEPKGKIQAWTPELKREAERVGKARMWIKGIFGLTRSAYRIPLHELLEIKAKRRIGKGLQEEIYIQLRELEKAAK